LFVEKIENFVRQKIKLDIKFRKNYEIYNVARNKIIANFLHIQKNKKDLVYKKEALRKKHTLIEQEIKNQVATTTIR